jgi:ParB family chromosome partitioning protein
VFEQIVGNIQNIGLKKPIIVTPRPGSNGEHYLLICGEGASRPSRRSGIKKSLQW